MYISEQAQALAAAVHRGPVGDFAPRTPTERLLYVAIISIPVAWLLGFGELVWLPIGLVLLYQLIRNRPRILVPRPFLLWVAFMTVAFLASFDLVVSGEVFRTHTFFLAIYVVGTLLFLFVFNAEASEIADKPLIGAVALLWVITVAGGVLAIPLNQVDYESPGTDLLSAVDADERLLSYTRVQFADRRNLGAEVDGFLGADRVRARSFYSETNHWGSAFAIALPAALMLVAMLKPSRVRSMLGVAFAAGLGTLVLSQNRWVWVVLLFTLAYAASRFWRPRPAHLVWAALVLAVGVIAFSATPIGDVVSARLSDGDGTGYRQEIYDLAFDRITEAPLLGFGQAISSGDAGYDGEFMDDRPIGFDSQIVNTMIFHGVPALLLLGAWLLSLVGGSARLQNPVEAVTHFAAVTAVLHSGFYVLLPHRMMLLMVLAAALYRGRVLDGSYPLSGLIGLRRQRRPT
ncbi:MAG: O-antigen ligase family protein [Acidimicrobiia bacterium]|nr:O-antigen ligase family protein [Acidimicrobiia bacterium]